MDRNEEIKARIVDNLSHGKPALADLTATHNNYQIADYTVANALDELCAEGKVIRNLERGGYELVGKP